jgi:hypothetical protein
MAHQVTAGRFVGRTQELARLGQLLASSLVAPIGGAAVIGKTRLGDQLAATGDQHRCGRAPGFPALAAPGLKSLALPRSNRRATESLKVTLHSSTGCFSGRSP